MTKDKNKVEGVPGTWGPNKGSCRSQASDCIHRALNLLWGLREIAEYPWVSMKSPEPYSRFIPRRDDVDGERRYTQQVVDLYGWRETLPKTTRPKPSCLVVLRCSCSDKANNSKVTRWMLSRLISGTLHEACVQCLPSTCFAHRPKI